MVLVQLGFTSILSSLSISTRISGQRLKALVLHPHFNLAEFWLKTHHCSSVVYSFGLCEIPSLLGTNIIAVGTRILVSALPISSILKATKPVVTCCAVHFEAHVFSSILFTCRSDTTDCGVMKSHSWTIPSLFKQECYSFC
jgi:hypothetical protein